MERSKCMRKQLLAGFGAIMLVAACTSGDQSGSEALTTFVSDGIEYELHTSPNSQGPEAPCVGVTVDLDDGARSVIACPTEDSEEDQYANALDLDGEYFVVGYGLTPGEEVALDDATISEGTHGRRFFVVQLEESPGSQSFEVPITGSDGSTRSITSYGVDG